MKPGHVVYQIERHPLFPGGLWKWEAVVLSVEDHCVETEFKREPLSWLTELTKNLAHDHKTYWKIRIKNYRGPDGSFDVEPR